MRQPTCDGGEIVTSSPEGVLEPPQRSYADHGTYAVTSVH